MHRPSYAGVRIFLPPSCIRGLALHIYWNRAYNFCVPPKIIRKTWEQENPHLAPCEHHWEYTPRSQHISQNYFVLRVVAIDRLLLILSQSRSASFPEYQYYPEWLHLPPGKYEVGLEIYIWLFWHHSYSKFTPGQLAVSIESMIYVFGRSQLQAG